ncbi:MAG: ABC transporter ATP-binding protein [Elusimicrobiota bacterium]
MLKLIGIKKDYGFPLLRSIDISVDDGEALALMGANGSGKTTIIKILSSVIIPDSGSIEIDGLELNSGSADARMITGSVFSDDRSFYMRLSGISNLRFYSRFYDINDKEFSTRLDHYSDKLGFKKKLLNRPVMEYSRGEKQVLSFLRLFINGTRHFFIDEPSISLDEEHRARIISALKEEMRTGKTVLFVTHSKEEAAELSSKVCFLKDGIIHHET